MRKVIVGGLRLWATVTVDIWILKTAHRLGRGLRRLWGSREVI